MPLALHDEELGCGQRDTWGAAKASRVGLGNTFCRSTFVQLYCTLYEIGKCRQKTTMA